MKKAKNTLQPILSRLFLLSLFSVLLLSNTNAQNRTKAGGGGGGGGAKKQGNVSKPTNNASKQNTGGGGDRNNAGGGDRKNVGGSDRNNGGGDRNNVSNSGNKNINAGNKNNIGNKTTIDNSKKNVNVNIDNSKNVRVNNSRNTAVRRTNNYRPYARPPYRYGGYRYNCYHPYYFHPYRPFVWGPMWHPWGFFIATLATTAIILSVDTDMPGNSDYAGINGEMPAALSGPAMMTSASNAEYLGDEYWYDQGVFYLKADGGYTVVSAPVGASIKTLPTGYETVSLDEGKTTNYYYGGTFYEKTSKGYTVVPPTAGAVVEHISEGGEETKMGDITYVKVGETYYQPIKQDSKDMYEVADVEEDK